MELSGLSTSRIPSAPNTAPVRSVAKRAGLGAVAEAQGAEDTGSVAIGGYGLPIAMPMLGFATQLQAQEAAGTGDGAPKQGSGAKEKKSSSGGKGEGNAGGKDGLNEDQQRQVDVLQARDREVRAHEQAHASTGGQYAGAPQYEFATGPDRRQYAVGGEVAIDTGGVPGDLRATVAKMDVVIRAALAPADPSGQDRAVAARAGAQRAQASAELQARNAQCASGAGNGEGASTTVNLVAAYSRGKSSGATGGTATIRAVA